MHADMTARDGSEWLIILVLSWGGTIFEGYLILGYFNLMSYGVTEILTRMSSETQEVY